MFETLFLNPANMIVGGALISSPIIIHLINRLRFKRVRWAAMEFLLKSQKRNRRRLIIEQLILLLLRILLVLLAGFLVARFLFAGQTTKGATHVVVLDDTMSMGDRGKDAAGKDAVAFDAGVEQIKQIARTAAQAPSAQLMKVYLLSDLQAPVYDGRLSDKSDQEIEEAVRKRGGRATLLHVSPLEGLKAARGQLNQPGFQGQKV